MPTATYHSTHPLADEFGRSPDAPNWSGDLRTLDLDDVIDRDRALVSAVGRAFIRSDAKEAHRLAGLATDCLGEMERRRG